MSAESTAGLHLIRQSRQLSRDAARSLWRGAVDLYESSDLTHASSIAYFALLSLFPGLLLVLSLLGSATASEEDRARVLEFVLRYFPQQLDFVTTQLDAFRHSRVPMGIAGSLLMTWASLGVFGAITSAVNHAWGVERPPSFWKEKLVSFLMMLAAGALLLVALALVSAQGVVGATWFADVVSRTPALAWFGGVVSRWATTALLTVVVGMVFYFVPNTAVRLRDVWFGAVVTGGLWHLALQGFTWYVGDLSRFSVHGSIATVVVFLLWVYVSSVILLYGAEVTAEFAKLRQGH